MKPEHASKYAKLFKALAVVLAIAMPLLVWFKIGDAMSLPGVAGNEVALNVEVKDLILSIQYPYIFYVMFYTAQVIFGGILQGGFDERTIFVYQSFGNLFIGLTLQIVLFSTMASKLAGVWFGLAVGTLCVCILLLVRLSKHDYEMTVFYIVKGREEQEKK